MLRALLLPALLLLVLPLPATAEHPVPERHLIGEWQDAAGGLLLEMRADRSASFTLPPTAPGQAAEVQFGGYALRDGIWTLRVTDQQKRVHFYSIVSLDLNRLNLLGANQAKITMYRIGLRFTDVDRNRDGLLEYHEVKETRIGRYFGDIDSNKDAQLTQAEFVAYWIRFPPPVVIQR